MIPFVSTGNYWDKRNTEIPMDSKVAAQDDKVQVDGCMSDNGFS